MATIPTPPIPSTPVCPECRDSGTIDVNDFGPDVLPCPSCRAARDRFSKRHDASADLDILCNILRRKLGAVPVACTCHGHDGNSCDRCELERIVAMHGAFEADDTMTDEETIELWRE